MNALTTTAPTHDEVVRVLQNSLYPGAKRESVELVLSYCRVNGIDPMLKPVHIVPTNVKVADNKWEKRDVLMPAIADYRIKAARSGEYGGKSEPEFGPTVTKKLGGIEVTFPEWCRVTISRIVQGQAREFTAIERWVENYATAARDTDKPNAMWQKRAFGQLAKCAEAQALRMAFPEFSGGTPTAEEMEGKELLTSGPMIEAKAEPSARREQINRDVPLADTPSEPQPQKMNWSQWADSLEISVREATNAELGRLLARAEVTEIYRLAKEGKPSPAKQRIIDAMSEAEERYLADPPEPEEDAPAIKGEEYVGAG